MSRCPPRQTGVDVGRVGLLAAHQLRQGPERLERRQPFAVAPKPTALTRTASRPARRWWRAADQARLHGCRGGHGHLTQASTGRRAAVHCPTARRARPDKSDRRGREWAGNGATRTCGDGPGCDLRRARGPGLRDRRGGRRRPRGLGLAPPGAGRPADRLRELRRGLGALDRVGARLGRLAGPRPVPRGGLDRPVHAGPGLQRLRLVRRQPSARLRPGRPRVRHSRPVPDRPAAQ